MKKPKIFKAAGDLIYTVMATVVLNVVLQIIIYPLITHFHGEDVTGNILYFIGIIYIVPQALGTTLGNVRLVIRKTCDVTNRDFVPYIVVLSAACSLACGFIGFSESRDLVFSVVYALFSVIYLLRIYSSVEFKLYLKIKGYFFYFCLVCIGYLVGFGLYMLTDIWLLIFLCGECLALGYTFIFGKMFRNDGKTRNHKALTKTIALVLVSTVIRDCVNQFDKVILKQVLSAGYVTQYHVVSLIAKTMLMLVQPINMLILTYLTVKDSYLSKKQLAQFTGITLGCGVLFYGLCVVGTPVFVKILYPDLYDAVMPYNLIVNLGLIIGFISTMFMSILLSQGKTAVHTVIQCVWGICYIAAAYYFVNEYMIWGLAYVTLVANAVKLVVSVIFTFVGNEKDEPEKITAAAP